MTTAVMPDLDAWMEGEIQEPCTIRLNWDDGPSRTCGRPAQWVAYVRFDCGLPALSRFVCATCYAEVARGLVYCSAGHGESHLVMPTWIERVR